MLFLLLLVTVGRPLSCCCLLKNTFFANEVSFTSCFDEWALAPDFLHWGQVVKHAIIACYKPLPLPCVRLGLLRAHLKALLYIKFALNEPGLPANLLLELLMMVYTLLYNITAIF